MFTKVNDKGINSHNEANIIAEPINVPTIMLMILVSVESIMCLSF